MAPEQTLLRVSRKLVQGRPTGRQALGSRVLCEKLTAVPAFLRVRFCSSQRMLSLPQEEEGTSCHWMCGLRLSGIFSMPQSQLWELGMRLRFPGPGRPGRDAAVQKHRGSGGWKAETIPEMLTPPVPSSVLNFLKEIQKGIYSVGLPESMFYKILL